MVQFKLEINKQKEIWKSTDIWKLNNRFLNNPQVEEEIIREIRKHFDLYENKFTENE